MRCDSTYHKYDDGKTLFRCDFCDQIVAKMWTATTTDD